MFDKFLELINNETPVQDLIKSKKKISVDGIIEEALIIASAFYYNPKKMLIIKNSLYSAQLLYERLCYFLPKNKVLLYPSDESLRIEAYATSKELLTQRIYVLNETLNSNDKIIITHTASLIRPVVSPFIFKNSIIKIKKGNRLNPSNLINKLIEYGYEKIIKIEHSLQCASRGGVLDIFSLNYEHPIRIEFFDEEVDNIRFFDLATQRTISFSEEIIILPASDLLIEENDLKNKVRQLRNKKEEKLKPSQEFANVYLSNEINALEDRSSYAVLLKYFSFLNNDKIFSLLDYCLDYQAIVSNLPAVLNNYELFTQETWSYIEELINENKDLIRFRLYDDIKYLLDKVNYLIFDNENQELKVRSVNECKGKKELLKELIKQYIKEDIKIIFFLDNPLQYDYVDSICKNLEIPLELMAELQPPSNMVNYHMGYLKEGFELISYKIVFITPLEIFGKPNLSKAEFSKYRNAQVIKNWESLYRGDYIVHESYGIGQFIEITTLEIDGIHRDYLLVMYRDEHKLYIPLEQFHLVRKYISREGAVPRLSKIGTSEWSKTKQKIKNRLNDIADRLIALYQVRNTTPGYAFEIVEDLEQDFTKAFAYQLTHDQQSGYEEIKKDMLQPFPMDRLLCGDVGFGKTEVAFKAVYIAYLNGKQSALLCPTTILSRQHYNTAVERFQNFGLKIVVLNRFVSKAVINENLKQIANGEIDLVIGTHRLLSKDVVFKDLGLLIIDEEQRFGVEHKERIKELKNHIDVLTLSATPIPRTLQMALVGIRNLSQINTPPSSRMPIQTYVLEYSERLLKEIIERELGRNGQVFFLHNDIASLNSLGSKIKSLVFNAKVGIAHGKMDREDIEDTMNRFYDKELNILICTTIIENGIDIPNANTIIIDNANDFGLSQLYQIKGRVGRSDRLGYAYLLYKPSKVLTEVAQKRLNAIKEFTELGSGYKIALRDLSIRGAGDILGAEQAGFIDSLGMDMYIKILQETIEEKKNGVVVQEEIIRQTMHLDAYIPGGFENDDNEKIELYKRIDGIATLEALKELETEINDLYGKIPENVGLLLEKREFEILCKNAVIESIVDKKESIELIFNEKINSIDGVGIIMFDLLNKILPTGKIIFSGKKIKLLYFKKNKTWLRQIIKYLSAFIKMIA